MEDDQLNFDDDLLAEEEELDPAEKSIATPEDPAGTRSIHFWCDAEFAQTIDDICAYNMMDRTTLVTTAAHHLLEYMARQRSAVFSAEDVPDHEPAPQAQAHPEPAPAPESWLIYSDDEDDVLEAAEDEADYSTPPDAR